MRTSGLSGGGRKTANSGVAEKWLTGMGRGRVVGDCDGPGSETATDSVGVV
jgi:hypothetical protein